MDLVNGKQKGSEFFVRDIPVNMLDAVIPLVAEYIRDGVKYHPVMELQDIVQMLYSRHLHLTVGILEDEIVGIAVFAVEQYPRERVCNVTVLGAKKGLMTLAWKQVMEHIEGWAAQRGCARVIADGRKGWMGAAKKMGFNVEQRTVLSKEIRDGQRRRNEHSPVQRAVERRPAVPDGELRS